MSTCRNSLLEKAMAPHSSVLAWRIPWTEEPGGLQCMGSQSRTHLSVFTFSLSLFILVVPIYIPTNSHLFFLHIFANMLSLVSFMIAILTVVRCYLIMVLISLAISDVEQLFLYLLAICVSFWKNTCSYPLPVFKLDFLFC